MMDTQAGADSQKKSRQEEKQSSLPVTVRVIQAAATSGESSEDVKIYGVEPSILILVGVVENLTLQAACTEFTLNDGTGRMRAKYFSSGSENPFSNIKSGQYVVLAAQLRTTPETHISITGARAVRTADEICFHTIECANAMLKLQFGKTGPVTPEKVKENVPVANPNISPPKVDAVPGTAASPVSVAVAAPSKPGLTSEALREAILKCLQDNQERAEGTSTEQLNAQFPSNSASDIKTLLMKLTDTGDVFNTIDDNHFAVI